MPDKEILALIGVVIAIISYAAYITSIFRGNTKPHPFSWIIWATLTAIAFFAQVSDNAGAGAWVTGITAVISFIIVGLAYTKNKDIKITRSDWITFGAALSAIPVWLITNNPLWSVLIITVIDALGFYPTFRKTWFHPHDELPFQYATAGLKFVLSIMALNHFSIITVLYPLSLVIMNWLFIAMLYWRRHQLRDTKTL